MKLKSTLLTFVAILMTMTSFTAVDRDEFTIEFITLGNCYSCKIRIEGKLSNVEGVISSNYDAVNKITSVTYDDLVTDAFLIMQAVADTGHDTEWFEAPLEAYELLIGTCCEYERTIDYTMAQVGYLSLMGLWMPHVLVGELNEENQITVYPTSSTGQYTVKFDNMATPHNPEIRIYSMSGSLVWANTIDSASNNQIDISFAPAGQYILCALTDGNIISKTKIIKK